MKWPRIFHLAKNRVQAVLDDGGNDLANRLTAERLTLAVQYACGAGVAGDVIEYGCHTGRTTAVLAAAVAYFGNKRLHVVDSFEGLPAANAVTDKLNTHVQDRTWSEGQFVASERHIDQICRLHLPTERYEIHKAWYSDFVLPTGVALSVVHLDCDLYLSTYDALWPLVKGRRLCDGCMILLDDYNACRANSYFGQRQAFAHVQANAAAYSFEPHCSYSWGGAAFIAHLK